jgi:hypothetical protein
MLQMTSSAKHNHPLDPLYDQLAELFQALPMKTLYRTSVFE